MLSSRFLNPALIFLLLLALVLGLVAFRTSPRRTKVPRSPFARRALWAGWFFWIMNWLFATPRVSAWAQSALEHEIPAADVTAALGNTPEARCAMVVLSGEKLPRDPITWGGLVFGGASEARALGAAKLYVQRPVGHVVVTGRAEPPGIPDRTAEVMADMLVANGVPRDRITIEPLAENTRENAERSAPIVRGFDPEKTILVTSAMHMPRAMAEFKRVKLPVTPAPVDYRSRPSRGGVQSLLPSPGSLLRMGGVFHEILGRLKP